MKIGTVEIGGRLSEWRWLAARTRGFRRDLLLLAVGGSLLSLFGVAFAALTRILVDRASGAGQGGLAGPLFGMAGLVIVQVVSQACYGVFSARLSVRLENGLRAELYNRLLAASWAHLHKRHSGDWVTRLTSDVSAVVSGVAGILPDMIALMVRFTAALGYLLVLDPMLGLIALASGPLLLVPGRLFAGRLRNLSRESRENESRIRGFVQESLRRNAVIKAFNLESVFGDQLARHQHVSLTLARRQAWVSTAPGAGLTLGYWAGYLLALATGTLRMQAGRATFGTLTAFLQLVGQIQAPFQGLVRSVPRLVAMLASAERIIEAEELPSESGVAAGPQPADGFEPATDLRGVDLVFRNVTFAYEQTRILDGASFVIRAGETVVLTGPSGEGKTTLLRLLLGLVHPDSGEVTVRETGSGGRLFPASPATRRFFAFVPQGNSLFSGTVRENIGYGQPGAPAEAGATAARVACADFFIRGLPEGYDARMGEGGDGLSEGQAQRIAIARALLRDAPVLVLDEATSALDLPTERAILDGIRALRPKRTLILVSHRPEAQAGCDRILRVRAGCVFEEAGQQEEIG
jgi:ABC-type multidrug transport system fused ATPase/permease subunit